MNKIWARICLVSLLFLMIFPIAFSLTNFIPSSPNTGTHSGAVPSRADADQGVYSPNPATWLKVGAFVQAQSSYQASGKEWNGSYSEYDGLAYLRNVTSLYPNAANPTAVTTS